MRVCPDLQRFAVVAAQLAGPEPKQPKPVLLVRFVALGVAGGSTLTG